MSTSVYDLPVEHIISYLQSKGWKLVSENDRWHVLEGYKDIEGNPFEITLPKSISVPDYPIYVQQAVNMLSSLMDKAPETIADDIMLYDRDILMIRVLENVDITSIPIGLASKQISELKQLIAYAASSERDAQPHFINPLATASEMVEHYRFGHTFAGSFGYRIESPIRDQESVQMNMFEDDLPLERRVMERIIRGLAATEKAAELQDVQPLIDGYIEGFNANMCAAILKMSGDYKEPIKYSIRWSNKINVSDDMRDINNISIQRQHFQYLKAASEQLKILEPESKTIKGRVISLSSQEDPQSERVAERSVIVQWDRGKERSRKVQISLERDDYMEALQAHSNWSTISVSGIIERKGPKWRLTEPKRFKVLS